MLPVYFIRDKKKGARHLFFNRQKKVPGTIFSEDGVLAVRGK